MIRWADVDYTKTAGKFPFQDGEITITHKEIIVWASKPAAVFQVTRHALPGDVQYLPTTWVVPEDMR